MKTRSSYNQTQRLLGLGLCLSIASCLLVLYYVIEPYLLSARVPKQEEATWQVPAYDYQPWHAQPVQVEGRVKPFQTAAIETMRAITGRSKLEGRDPVAVLLMWMVTHGGTEGIPPEGVEFPDWDTYPFILADHHGLRSWIYAHKVRDEDDTPLRGDEINSEVMAEAQAKLTEGQKHGKYVSPYDLRTSPGFKRLTREVTDIRRKHDDKASQFMSPEQKKASEVERRLRQYNAIARPKNLDEEYRDRMVFTDPIKFAMLNRVPNSDWLSIGDIHDLRNPPEGTPQDIWERLLKMKMREYPVLYLEPEKLRVLEEFQIALSEGRAEAMIDDLVEERQSNIEKGVKELVDRGIFPADLTEDLKGEVEARGPELVGGLRERVQQAQADNYVPDNPKFMPLHLDYLEARFPFVYHEATARQDYPAERAKQVANAWADFREAYLSGNADQFNDASREFFNVVERVSDETVIDEFSQRPGEMYETAGKAFDEATTETEGDESRSARDAFFQSLANAKVDVPRYPISDTIELELTFNKVQPFMWAWIVMIPALMLFLASYMTGSRVVYGLGFGMFGVSLALQVFGFYCRIAISGRPPVSNMYETIIFVAFMSAVFGMALELIYRKAVIAIAASLVSLIALVLADQLPTAFDPGIQPLVPVLRSNFWLIIHVLTITASYAGGALAWGLANVALGMLAFGTPKKETLKTLSTYTYRAMQIAVLLLAAGTFLGGWWAAYSWGRFWGWDPKETWALISLVCYVIPLHARYVGWVKDFGLAVSAVICFAAILMCWYGVNFVLGAGLHSYGFGGGGPYWVLLAGLLNLVWVCAASMIYLNRTTGAELRRMEEIEDKGESDEEVDRQA